MNKFTKARDLFEESQDLQKELWATITAAILEHLIHVSSTTTQALSEHTALNRCLLESACLRLHREKKITRHRVVYAETDQQIWATEWK